MEFKAVNHFPLQGEFGVSPKLNKYYFQKRNPTAESSEEVEIYSLFMGI
jgi:hypothetical protein